MTDKLPWSISVTLTGQPNTPDPTDPMNVTYRRSARGKWHVLFRKCCGCMYCNVEESEAAKGFGPDRMVEFICGCGSHPSVMVCNGELVGTSA